MVQRVSSNETFAAAAWHSGSPSLSGTGYGLKISTADRDRHFSKDWRTVLLHLEGRVETIEVNVGKASFWNGSCRELIGAEIGRWLLAAGKAPWPKGQPPRVMLTAYGERVFCVRFGS